MSQNDDQNLEPRTSIESEPVHVDAGEIEEGGYFNLDTSDYPNHVVVWGYLQDGAEVNFTSWDGRTNIQESVQTHTGNTEPYSINLGDPSELRDERVFVIVFNETV